MYSYVQYVDELHIMMDHIFFRTYDTIISNTYGIHHCFHVFLSRLALITILNSRTLYVISPFSLLHFQPFSASPGFVAFQRASLSI